MARPRKFDETQVMRAVRDQFWQGGYAGTSLDELTAATKLGRGSLYGAFGDKHTLYVRTLEEYCTETVGGIRDFLNGPGPALERLCEFFRNAAFEATADPDRRGCLMAKSAAELATTDAEVATKVSRAFDQLHLILADSVRAAQAEGSIAADADPGGLASLLLAVMRGMEALSKGGAAASVISGAAEQALALLPVPAQPNI